MRDHSDKAYIFLIKIAQLLQILGFQIAPIDPSILPTHSHQIHIFILFLVAGHPQN